MGSADPDIMNALPTSIQKDWHAQVTNDLRNHLIFKLVQAFNPDSTPMGDIQKANIVTFAVKEELAMYETANNRGEYYHLLAERVYIIQKEREEKRIAEDVKANNLEASLQELSM